MTFEEQTVSTGLQAKGDGALLRLYARSQSQGAFAELGRRYARLVYATCVRETGDLTLAEDAAQGVFLLLSQKSQSLKRRDTLADWLYTASRYVSRNLRKQEQRRQMNEALASREISLAPTVGLSASEPQWEQIEPHLNTALDRLKPADREAVLLRFVQQQSLAEVGEGLGISENAARMRVQRALAKMRLSLNRAGIAVSLSLLAALLLERSAPAAPLALLARLSSADADFPEGRTAGLTRAVRRASLRLTLVPVMKTLIAVFFVAALTVDYHRIQILFSAQHLSLEEQHRQFQMLDGTWRGTLEYADDRTGKHFTYPTTVTIRNLDEGSGLNLIATYAGSPAVDSTTYGPGPRAGTFSVTNGGPQSSHGLAGIGELVKRPGGGFAFQGKNAGQNSDVRVQFTLRPQALTMQEDYRLPSETTYRFRNRFSLQKQKR